MRTRGEARLRRVVLDSQRRPIVRDSGGYVGQLRLASRERDKRTQDAVGRKTRRALDAVSLFG